MKDQNELLQIDKKRTRKKSLRRFFPIVLNGIRSVLSPIIFIIFSYLVVHFHSKELWGGFVDYLLFFYLASLFSNWGSKDYLQRSFSEAPKSIISNWQAHFLARLPLLMLTIAIVPFVFGLDTFFYFSIWLIGGFINNALVPVYTYRRDFGKVILIELVGAAVLLLLASRNEQALTVPDLVHLFAIYQWIKAIFYGSTYISFFKFKKFKLQFSLLLLSLPFFFMGCAGFLQSKVDLYVFGFFHNDALLGEYQIISGFFIFSQSIATILLLPYLKNIYRMKSGSIVTLKRQMIWVGFILNGLAVMAIWLGLSIFFEIDLSAWELIAGFFIGWPSYVYALHIFYLFKQNRERVVLLISVVSLGFNLILSLVLLSLEVGILGVLIANSVAQIIALFLYLRKKIDDDIFKKTE